MKKIVVRTALLHSFDEGFSERFSLEVVSGRRRHAHRKIAKAVQYAPFWRSSCSVSALICAGKVFLPLSVVTSAFVRGSERLLCPVLRGPFRRQWGVVLTGEYRPQLKPERALVHVAAQFSNREDAELFLFRNRTRSLIPASHLIYSAEQIYRDFELSVRVVELMIDRNGVILAAVPTPNALHRRFFFLRSTDD